MQDEWLDWENRRPPPARSRTTLIGGHFPPEMARELALIAARERKTKKALLKEALDLLFASRREAGAEPQRDAGDLQAATQASAGRTEDSSPPKKDKARKKEKAGRREKKAKEKREKGSKKAKA